MIRVAALHKSFSSHDRSSVQALQDVSFESREGEFYTLLGPSGCGKTTTLRCIAGFETPESGEIWVGDELVFSAREGKNIPPAKRPIGIVFQSYAIWPHMTVFDNVAFPLVHGRKKFSRDQTRELVLRVLELVQLQALADRPAPFLSGGQQQRVALARALVHEPKVLLLDEPLSNLDAKLREDMRLEIRALVKRLGITTLYVTHDQLEALTMSDRIAVMQGGKIMQEGTPVEIYKAPQTRMVAHFVGLANFLEGTVTAVANGLGEIETAGCMLRCPVTKHSKIGEPVIIMIRPEDVDVCTSEASPRDNVLPATTQSVVFTGESLDCWFSTSDHRLRAKVHSAANLRPGDPVLLRLPAEYCRVISGSESA